MHQPKIKYSITIKPSQQTCTIKSVLAPDLKRFNAAKISVIWYRQPPSPYEIEELSHNFNSFTYKCSSLDFECKIMCKIFTEESKEAAKFDYGPVETFVYSRLSTSLELRVHVLLFGTWKKCVFALGAAPTLINPQNNNKYQLTHQDIKSIFFKHQPLSLSKETSQTQSQTEGLSIINSQLKKTIVVQNLFQRLILLKLFHQIPNKMYCHSTEVLEISFYDQSSCNMALLAINRFKYQKRDTSDATKSMYGLQPQDSTVSKIMKKSNDSFTKLQGQFQPNGPIKNYSEDTLKKQFLPLSAFTNWRKSPKESINSANQSSIISGNSSRANDSRTSLIQKNLQITRNMGQNESQGLGSKGSSQYRSRVSIKHPKISILSTDINSTKQRQQKPSFPENPPSTHTLKSSQLLIKPNQFKSSLSLRRSQQEIKTPRMDVDDEVTNSAAKNQGPVKKKSASEIQVPDTAEQTEDKDQYVNQFQNLLFQVGEDDNKEAEFCLNDSFARLEEEQEKQKLQIIVSPAQITSNINSSSSQKMSNFMPPPSPTKSERNLDSLKETLKCVLQQNFDLRQKNEELKKEIIQAKTNGDKKSEIEKYQGEIRKMQEIRNQLQVEIQGLKKSVLLTSSSVLEKSNMQTSWINQSAEKQKPAYSYSRLQEKASKESPSKQPGGFKQYLSCKKSQSFKYSGNNTLFPPRQSKVSQQISIKPIQASSSTFIARRSQQCETSNFVTRQAEQAPQQQSFKNNIVFNSGDLKFMKFQQDPDYQKFRTNQSYSYKQSQTIKMDDKRLPREYQPYKY